jgi:hypothetical protein
MGLQGCVRRGSLLVVGGVLIGVAVADARSPVRRWDLGRGFTAIVTTSHRVPNGFRARRTLEIKRDGVVVRRFSSVNDGLGVQVSSVPVGGVRELLMLDYQDGTGACGTYRLYAGPALRVAWGRGACADTAVARLNGDALIVWSAVLDTKTPWSGSSPHCCWRVWRRTELRWNGRSMRRDRMSLGPAPPPKYRDRLLPGALPPAP